MEGPLTVLEDLSERLHYNNHELHVYTHNDELARYGYQALCHWHPDLEFIYIVSGTMDYFINGKIVRLVGGQGIFVNSKRLHYGFSHEHYECNFIALVINPDIFLNSSSIFNSIMDQEFGFQSEDYIVLYPHVKWQNEALKDIVRIHEYIEDPHSNPLLILSRSIEILGNISGHIEVKESNQEDNKMQYTFLTMTNYIHEHYHDKMTIDDIASSGMVCRSECCKLFKKYLRNSPISYLNEYRLIKSQELLRDTNLSITDIALYCGYTTASYFTSSFKKAYGITPQAYRSHPIK